MAPPGTGAQRHRRFQTEGNEMRAPSGVWGALDEHGLDFTLSSLTKFFGWWISCVKFFPGQGDLQLFCDICKLCSSKQTFAVMFSKTYVLSKQPSHFLAKRAGDPVPCSPGINTKGVEWPGGHSAGNVSPLAQRTQRQPKGDFTVPSKKLSGINLMLVQIKGLFW